MTIFYAVFSLYVVLVKNWINGGKGVIVLWQAYEGRNVLNSWVKPLAEERNGLNIVDKVANLLTAFLHIFLLF